MEVDGRREKVNFKIREAQMQKVPYMLVVGDREVESGAALRAVPHRRRPGGQVSIEADLSEGARMLRQAIC